MHYDDKKLILPQNRNVILPLIIFSNLFPLYGVINYNWTIFTVVYIYWFELLIITFFQFLKIITSQGESSISTWTKIFIGIKFLIGRCSLFLFYLIFIVTFLGVLASVKEDGKTNAVGMFEAIFFRGTFYRITLLSFILYNLVDFIVLFILNDNYKTAKPADNNNLLDAHILVVHIVVVLGTFLYQGVTDKLHWDHKSAMIACVSLFVFIKIIADFIKQSISGDTTDDQTGKFI